MILMQANINRHRSGCRRQSVEIITDKPTEGEISIQQPVSVAEQAGLTLTWSQTQYLCQHA